jgi:hypothetical protein
MIKYDKDKDLLQVNKLIIRGEVLEQLSTVNAPQAYVMRISEKDDMRVMTLAKWDLGLREKNGNYHAGQKTSGG